MTKNVALEEGLAPEELDYFVDRYVLLKSTPAAREALYRDFPKAREYHLNTFNKWRKANEKRIGERRAEVNANVREKPLVQRTERITLLTHALGKVLYRLEKADLDDITPRDLATLCGEVRLGLKAIAEESLPYDQDFKDQVMAPINVILGQLTPEVREYALTGEKPKKPEVPS